MRKGIIFVDGDNMRYSDLFPESNTMADPRPDACKDRTAWMATYIAGVLKVSNMI